jgi:hypothetical protein
LITVSGTAEGRTELIVVAKSSFVVSSRACEGHVGVSGAGGYFEHRRSRSNDEDSSERERDSQFKLSSFRTRAFSIQKQSLLHLVAVSLLSAKIARIEKTIFFVIV